MPESWQEWSPEEKKKLLATLKFAQWRQAARTDQLPPRGPWVTLYLRGGRGSGKTWSGGHILLERVLADPEPGEWAVVAPTYEDAWATCCEGPSGILAALGTNAVQVKQHDSPLVRYWNRTMGELRMRNGHLIRFASADDGALRIQGKNLKGVWADEIGLWDKWQTAWDESIQYAVRMGDAIRIVTGTPKSSRKARELIKRLMLDPAVHVQVLRTVDNAANLSPAFMASVVAAAKGTRLERQELEGELLEDVDGALWTLEMIERGRVDEHPELSRIVVAVDPAVTGSETSDESGIVVVGEHQGHGYVLADYSMVGSPQEVMEKVVWAYHEHQADRVLAEVNNGGDYIGTLLRVVDSSVPYQAVRATRGKLLRAEPVAALYEQGRMHHVGRYLDLEEQMIVWHPDSSKSPDRLDALAWAVAGLRTLTAGSWAQAHGIVYCDECQQPFMIKLHPLNCPNCRTTHGKGTEIGS